jgi:L-Ala-D/L-Glu epimerase
VNLRIDSVPARLRAPMVSARGAVSERELLLVRVQDAQGLVGAGEAAPLQSYDGVSMDDVRSALEDCRPVLERGDGSGRAELLAACARAAVLPQALAAIDLALWDLEGHRQGEPVWRLLGASKAPALAVNATVAQADRAGAAAAARRAADAGFTCVKVKVGLGDDAGRLAAVRAAAGPGMAIRLDANGAWTPEEAMAALRMLQATGIELCEEPCSGLDAIAEVSAASPVPIALDESSALPGALDRAVCASVCLKITRAGGISGLIDSSRRARAAGYSVYLASTLDGPLGIAAALHAATAVKPEHACGLATLSMFSGASAPVPLRAGQMTPPPGAGLGEGLLGWYLSRLR